ncbi:MAG TPA: GFA family protein [Burkholderiaceae bacterium]|nr:GFA family protein [Burkholderiaceae bacterium]
MSDATTKSLPPLTGGCLCGRVRYEATPDHRDGYYCHCRMCQLAVGNTRAAFINLRKAELRWLSEPSYYASSKIARRGFCGRCGTPLSFDYLDGERIDLTVGSLDDPSAVKPTTHFSVETRIPAWHADDSLPGERLDTNERINQRWRKAYGDNVAPGLDAARAG